MKQQKTVVVYGSSLFSAGIEASLQRIQEFLVVQIDETQADAVEHINVLRPDVMVVDASTSPWNFAITCLQQNPSMALIGIEPANSSVLMISGQYTVLSSMKELTRMVVRHIQHNHVAPKLIDIDMT
jgi:chemotaxis response regulator CheB